MDTMKMARSVYQYTAIDDCSRFRVLAVYPRRNARNTLNFLDCVIEEVLFPIQRIQPDRGGKFFADSVQQRRLMSECIKFRPIPPRSPHLNDKVERIQLTDLNEFWLRHTPTEDEIEQRIDEWQFDYNWRRPHGSLSGKTHVDRIAEVGEITPLPEQMQSAFDEQKERIRRREWRVDGTLPNIIGACLSSRLLLDPRAQARREIGLQESETMSVNRTPSNAVSPLSGS